MTDSNDIETLVSDAIDTILESQLEYAEQHTDSGSNYSHLPRESWSNTDDDRLAAFMEANDIDAEGLDLGQIVELVLENFEMESKHMFATVQPYVFSADSFPIGEIEVQIELDTLHNMIEMELDDIELIQALKELDYTVDKHGSFLAYNQSDMYWSADISANELKSLIHEQSEASQVDAIESFIAS